MRGNGTRRLVVASDGDQGAAPSRTEHQLGPLPTNWTSEMPFSRVPTEANRRPLVGLDDVSNGRSLRRGTRRGLATIRCDQGKRRRHLDIGAKLVRDSGGPIARVIPRSPFCTCSISKLIFHAEHSQSNHPPLLAEVISNA